MLHSKMFTTIILLNSLKNRLYSLILCTLSRNTSSLIRRYAKFNFIPVGDGELFKSKPKSIRMWIDGQCFNIKPFREKHKKYKNGPSKESTYEVADMSNFTFSTKNTGLTTVAFNLPFHYYKKLRIGDIFDLKSLMNRTNTHILIPSTGESEKLKIMGENKQQLKEAVQEVHSIIGQIRNETRPLHFIGVPMCNEEIKKKFAEFKNELMKETNIKGFDESIFQNPLKLHLTVDVMVLLNEKEQQEAIFALNDYHRTILKPFLDKTGPLRIRVEGIECMNNNNKYDKVNILYAKAKLVEENEEIKLQTILNNLSNYFYERGLLKKHQENITIHMTLMNTKYRELRSTPKASKSKRYIKRITFDATKIMEKYRDFEFGECDLNTVHISIMTAINDDGFYKPLHVIQV